MAKRQDEEINSEEWIEIREFIDEDDDITFPKYEVKFIEEPDEERIEDEIILVKKVQPTGKKRMYHIPREVFEVVVDHLPG